MECTKPQVATDPQYLPTGCCPDPQSCSPAQGSIVSASMHTCPAPHSQPQVRPLPQPQFHSGLTRGPLDLWVLQLLSHQNLGQPSPKAGRGTERLPDAWVHVASPHSWVHETSAGMLLQITGFRVAIDVTLAPSLVQSPASGLSHFIQSWKLVDFLAIRGPALFQKCCWEPRSAVIMATDACPPPGGLGVTRVGGQEGTGNWRCRSHYKH